jgi:hypothetical protein
MLRVYFLRMYVKSNIYVLFRVIVSASTLGCWKLSNTYAVLYDCSGITNLVAIFENVCL